MKKCINCDYCGEFIMDVVDDKYVYFCPNCGEMLSEEGVVLLKEASKEEINKYEESLKIKVEKKIETSSTPTRTFCYNGKRKEYKVISQTDGWFSRSFNSAQLEQVLNNFAKQGWVLKAVTTAEIPSLLMEKREEMILILERDVE